MELDNGENSTDFDAEIKSPLSTARLFRDIAMVLFAIIGISANIIIIYIIVRFKHLRTVDYLYLANWAISDIGSLFITIILFNILDYFVDHTKAWCVYSHLATTLQVVTVFFVLLISIDWCLCTFFTNASQIFRRFYKYTIGGTWIISLFVSIYSWSYCLAVTYSDLPSDLLLIEFFALMLIVVVLQITRGVQKCKRRPIESSTLMLTLPTSFIACWLLGFILFIVAHSANLHPIMASVAEFIIFGTSIVALGLLYRLNTEFQSCFMQVFKRSTKYEDRVSSLDNSSVNISNHDDCIQISFDNPKDELLKNAY